MALLTVKDLLDDFHNCGINYCHWKSNEHIEDAVNADTDLDILFDIDQKNSVEEILEKNGFQLFEAVWYKKYHGIVDYIGFDRNSAKIIHIHTHFHLDMGEIGIKSYSLPWEKVILKTKKFDSQRNIYISSPEMETLLLIVRTSFKLERFKNSSNKKVIRVFKKEFKWLKHQLNLESLREISRALLPGQTQALIEKIATESDQNIFVFWKVKSILKPYFAKNRVLSSSKVGALKSLNLFLRIKYKVYNKIGIQHLRKRRALPDEGLVIALMGPDGGGKSTQTNLLIKELKKKVDVVYMYMGSGNGPKSWHRALIEKIYDILNANKPKTKSDLKGVESELKRQNPSTSSIAKKGFTRQVLLSIKYFSLGIELKSQLRRIKNEKKKGRIIVCDRYPQTTIMGYNDGPKLSDNLNSKFTILKAMAKYEYKCYKLSDKIHPDIVFKFTGDLNVLHSRRPEMNIKDIHKKQEGIKKIYFNESTWVENINIEDSILNIKGHILDTIAQRLKTSKE